MNNQTNHKTIMFRPIFENQMEQSSFRMAYDALAEEFAFASQIIDVHAKAKLTQEKLRLLIKIQPKV